MDVLYGCSTDDQIDDASGSCSEGEHELPAWIRERMARRRANKIRRCPRDYWHQASLYGVQACPWAIIRMTLKEFRAKGGKARWRGVSKKKRKAEMRRVAKLRHSGKTKG